MAKKYKFYQMNVEETQISTKGHGKSDFDQRITAKAQILSKNWGRGKMLIFLNGHVMNNLFNKSSSLSHLCLLL